MYESTDALTALGNVGVELPVDGDAGDRRIRAALAAELTGRRPRRRVPLPFGLGSVALVPAGMLALAATAAAAVGTVALVDANPQTLFQNSPLGAGMTDQIQTVIPSSVRQIDTFSVPGIGQMQYWVADTEQHGLCQALRGPDGKWAPYGGGGADTAGGNVPGCGQTREQSIDDGAPLLPMSVDEQAISLHTADGQWWDIYYGIVAAQGATGVEDLSTGQTAPLIEDQHFVLVTQQTGRCENCDDLRAIDAAGHVLPADYGPVDERDH